MPTAEAVYKYLEHHLSPIMKTAERFFSGTMIV